MVDVMYEKSTAYFKKFQKRFKIVIYETEPKFEKSKLETMHTVIFRQLIVLTIAHLVLIISVLYLKLSHKSKI